MANGKYIKLKNDCVDCDPICKTCKTNKTECTACNGAGRFDDTNGVT